MKLWLVSMAFIGFNITLIAQQQVTIVSECGGLDTITIPNIVDNDMDGMDDALEQLLLDRFMPYIVQYNSDDCPGPNTNGTGDTNLVVSRIYPVPQQYTTSNSMDSINTNPVAVAAPRGLSVGLYWYATVVKVNSALLYGRDCGLISHTADVEGFNFSIKYTGNLPGGWMYDTNMQNWIGGSIQTISHAGTFCEAVQTFPYRSTANPTGKDTIYPSPDKHGNFLTVQQCSSNFICDPACSGASTRKKVKNINIGEPGAPLVADLATIYAPYAGENPWGNVDFLNGGAGTIKGKMELPLTSAFFQGVQLSNQATICNLYRNCYGTAVSAILAYTCAGTSYNFYGQQLTTPGVYTETLPTPYGCDSIVTLTLTLEQPDSVTVNAAICTGTTYTFAGQQLTTAGAYQGLFANSLGCDSVVTLQLSVDAVINIALSETICAGDVYPFQGGNISLAGFYTDTLIATGGCDSIITLNLAVDTFINTSYAANICFGESYQFDGQALTTAGIYTDTLTATNGCDSIITLQLEVDALPATPSINISGNELSTDSGGVDYQWYLNGSPITGAETASHTAIVAGYYQVGIMNTAGCIATSDSIWVALVGINSPAPTLVRLYPNPAQGQITLSLPNGQAHTTVTIFSVAGKQVYNSEMVGNSITINLEGFAKGLYLVRVASGEWQWNGKLVHE